MPLLRRPPCVRGDKLYRLLQRDISPSTPSPHPHPRQTCVHAERYRCIARIYGGADTTVTVTYLRKRNAYCTNGFLVFHRTIVTVDEIRLSVKYNENLSNSLQSCANCFEIRKSEVFICMRNLSLSKLNRDHSWGDPREVSPPLFKKLFIFQSSA